VVPVDLCHLLDEVLGDRPQPWMPLLQLLASGHDIQGKLGTALQPLLVSAQGVAYKDAGGGLCNHTEQLLMQVDRRPVWGVAMWSARGLVWVRGNLG